MTLVMSRDSCNGQFVLTIQSHNNTFVETRSPGLQQRPSQTVSLLINQTTWSISIICGYLSLVTNWVHHEIREFPPHWHIRYIFVSLLHVSSWARVVLMSLEIRAAHPSTHDPALKESIHFLFTTTFMILADLKPESLSSIPEFLSLWEFNTFILRFLNCFLFCRKERGIFVFLWIFVEHAEHVEICLNFFQWEFENVKMRMRAELGKEF